MTVKRNFSDTTKKNAIVRNLQMNARDKYLKIVEWSEEDQYKALAIEALHHGESLNSYCVHMLREAKSRYGEKKRRVEKYI